MTLAQVVSSLFVSLETDPIVKFFKSFPVLSFVLRKQTTLIGIPISVYKEFYVLSCLIPITIHELIQAVILILIFQIQKLILRETHVEKLIFNK